MFIESLSNVNNNEEALDSIAEAVSYSYNDFMEDMLLIESSIFDLINNHSRVIQETAIENLLEGTLQIPEKTGEYEKKKFITKAKEICNKIIEKFKLMLDSLYSAIYKEVVLKTSNILKHKEDIMKRNIIYKKVKAEYIDTKGKNHHISDLYVSEPYIETYRNIISPNFIEPLVSEKDLEKYMNDGNVDTNALYEYYMNEILGDKRQVSIEKINSSKRDLIKNLTDIYNEVKTRKKKIISLNNKIPENLSAEDLKIFQDHIKAEGQSLKIYNKVLLIYLKEDSRLLRMYISKGASNDEEGGEE